MKQITVKDNEGNTAILEKGLSLFGRRQYGFYAPPEKKGKDLSHRYAVTKFWFGIRNGGYDSKTSARVQAYIDSAYERNTGLPAQLAIRCGHQHLNASLQADGTYALGFSDGMRFYLTPKGDLLS